jgi:hypothetical protein
MKKLQIDIRECKQGKMYTTWRTDLNPFLFLGMKKEPKDYHVVTVLTKEGIKVLYFSDAYGYGMWVNEME